MSLRRRAQLQVIETEPDRAVTRLHHLIRHRDALAYPVPRLLDGDFSRRRGCRSRSMGRGLAGTRLRQCRAGMPVRFLADERRPQIRAYAQRPRRFRPRGGGYLPRRRCASRAGLPAGVAGGAAKVAVSRPTSRFGLAALVRLAREAPESVVAVASRTDMILQACDSSGF